MNAVFTGDSNYKIKIGLFGKLMSCKRLQYYAACSGPITTEEVTLAIKRLKKEKSPGVDNLLNEYLYY